MTRVLAWFLTALIALPLLADDPFATLDSVQLHVTGSVETFQEIDGVGPQRGHVSLRYWSDGERFRARGQSSELEIVDDIEIAWDGASLQTLMSADETLILSSGPLPNVLPTAALNPLWVMLGAHFNRTDCADCETLSLDQMKLASAGLLAVNEARTDRSGTVVTVEVSPGAIRHVDPTSGGVTFFAMLSEHEAGIPRRIHAQAFDENGEVAVEHELEVIELELNQIIPSDTFTLEWPRHVFDADSQQNLQ